MLELSRELDDKGNIATALNSLGTLALAQGDNERARALLEENMAVLRELEDERDTSTALKRFHALNLLGALAVNEEGDYVRGATLWEESLALAREAGDALRIGMAQCLLGYAALLQGDHERATALCEETLAFVHEHGSAAAEIVPETLVNLGLAALNLGDHARAAASFEKALMMSQESGRRPTVINTLEGMVSLAGAMGEATRAAHLWGAAEAAREVTDIALPPGERALHEPFLAAARSRLGEAEWEKALARGRVMSLDEAAEYALAKEVETAAPTMVVPERPPAGEPLSVLTRREREIAVLVARGLTNREISTRLGISERTAGNHVGTILRKLGLRSRAQIAAWATERDLLAPDAN
jgi:DNA-binding CsgD family transcriptional regulator